VVGAHIELLGWEVRAATVAPEHVHLWPPRVQAARPTQPRDTQQNVRRAPVDAHHEADVHDKADVHHVVACITRLMRTMRLTRAP